MPLNPLLSLNVRTLDTATPLLQFNELQRQKKSDVQDAELGKQQSELNSLKIDRQKYENFDARQKADFENSVINAKNFLAVAESGDEKGVEQFFNNLKKSQNERRAAGQVVDSSLTDRGWELWNGSPEDRQKAIEGAKRVIVAGEAVGLKENTPAPLQLVAAYNDAVKRGDNKTAQLIRDFAKVDEKGIVINTQGEASARPGASEALGALKRGENYGGESGTLQAQGELKPQVEQKVAEAKKIGEVKGDVLPPKIQEKQDELIDEITIGETINADLQGFIGQIDSKELDLDVVGNAWQRTQNKLSLSNEQSVALERFDSFIEKLRNDSLRLNKGIQTEGDAERAMNELIRNKSDPAVVRKRLEDIAEINRRGSKIKELRVQLMREENRKSPLELEKFKSEAKKTPFAPKTDIKRLEVAPSTKPIIDDLKAGRITPEEAKKRLKEVEID